MLGRAAEFIRKNLNIKNNPVSRAWHEARERRNQKEYERRTQMTYAEIEAEISKRYEAIFGRKLDWDNPKTYNEKIHVSKLYMPTPEKTRLADKYLVREWIREKIGGQYLIPLLGVYDSFDEIDFDALPDKFVIKCNHDCGSVTLVKDKNALDLEALKHKYDRAMSRNFAYMGFEMHYRDIRPKILIEQYIGDTINEYKFYCFNGKPCFCFATFGRRNVDLSISFYDMNWNLLPFTRPDHTAYTGEAPCPQKYDDMKNIALRLCSGFEHVRVDLYIAYGNIYNGEITFTTANGFGKFMPDEWDYKFGELWPFDNTVRRKVLAQRTKP